MSDKVTAIFGGPTYEREPHPDAIRAAEELLEAVKSGEIIGFGVAKLGFDGLASYELAGTIGSYSMIGAVEVIKSILIEVQFSD